VGLLPEALAEREVVVGRGPTAGPGMACGMCGIEPSVLGLAALRAIGARSGVALESATSADAGADPRRAVGYLSVAFGA
jgi:AmmeMemoRadiSam system protein B